MKAEKMETQTKRGPKARVPEEKSMADSIPPPDLDKLDTEPDFPIEWISIAAYYIWKIEGEPEGRDVEYWERAKAELTQLRELGKIPASRLS